MIERARRWSVLFFICAATWVGLSSCTHDSRSSAPDASEVCHAYAAAACAKYAACNPVNVRQDYGDVENCTARWTLSCLVYAGNGWATAQIEHCTEQIKPSTSCFEGNPGLIKECWHTPGTLPSGATCDVSTQCASLTCEFRFELHADGGFSIPVCGACAPGARPPGCGDAGACESPRRCVYGRDFKPQCTMPQPEGAPCVAQYGGCEDGLFCQRPPSSSGTWVCSKLGAAGVACTDHDGCAHKAGLRCIAGVCDVPTFVATGAACDFEGRFCENGHCQYPMPVPLPPTPPGTPTCKAFLDEGSPCDDALSFEPECRFPAKCRSGQCRLPGDAQCRAY